MAGRLSGLTDKYGEQTNQYCFPFGENLYGQASKYSKRARTMKNRDSRWYSKQIFETSCSNGNLPRRVKESLGKKPAPCLPMPVCRLPITDPVSGGKSVPLAPAKIYMAPTDGPRWPLDSGAGSESGDHRVLSAFDSGRGCDWSIVILR